MTEVERQLGLGVDGLPPKSSCLLEINPANLYVTSNMAQQHWLNAIIMVQELGVEAIQQTEGASTSWGSLTKAGTLQMEANLAKLTLPLDPEPSSLVDIIIALQGTKQAPRQS